METVTFFLIGAALGWFCGEGIKHFLFGAERSGVLQGCPTSANGCPEARADGEPGADSSVRCPEANGRCCVVCGSTLLLPIKRAPMPHTILHCNHCGSEVAEFVANDLARWIQTGRWGNEQFKGSSSDAPPAAGERVLPGNSDYANRPG